MRDPEDQPDDRPADRLAAWRASLAAVLHRYFRALRSMRLRVRASAGLALLKLDATVDALNPPDVRTDAAGRLDMTSVADLALFNAVWSEHPDMAVLEDRVAELRGCVERVGDELCARLGTTRSRAAFVRRFKHRCEWHDRGRMLAVANDDRLGGGAGDRVTAEFARYLFDAGLNPITRLLGRRPASERFDPTTTFQSRPRSTPAASRATNCPALSIVPFTPCERSAPADCSSTKGGWSSCAAVGRASTYSSCCKPRTVGCTSPSST